MSCKKCENKVDNQIVHLSGVGFFNVSRAISIIKKKPRNKEVLSNKELGWYAKRSKIKPNVKHLSHVDISFPVIIGRTETESFILDGNHRVTHCYYNGFKRLYAYHLTEFETGQVFSPKPPTGMKFIS